jgi:hypothetical protein
MAYSMCRIDINREFDAVGGRTVGTTFRSTWCNAAALADSSWKWKRW